MAPSTPMNDAGDVGLLNAISRGYFALCYALLRQVADFSDIVLRQMGAVMRRASWPALDMAENMIGMKNIFGMSYNLKIAEIVISSVSVYVVDFFIFRYFGNEVLPNQSRNHPVLAWTTNTCESNAADSIGNAWLEDIRDFLVFVFSPSPSFTDSNNESSITNFINTFVPCNWFSCHSTIVIAKSMAV